MMRQKSLRKGQMDGATLVFHTRKKLGDLVKAESRGWGDDSNALRRLSTHFRIPFSYLWRLLYKHEEVKDVRGSVLLKLWIAHEAMCERQKEKYWKERGEAEPTGRISQALVSAASALAGEADAEE